MNRILKFAAIVIGVLFTLFALTMIAISLLFDPNDYREDIAKAVYEETGRELTIEGDLSFSVFPWIALEIGKTTLGDSPNFGGEPFLTFDSASFSVKLIPAMFEQEVIVGSADITGLNLNLKVDEQGNSNWTDFPEPDPEEAERDAEVQVLVEQNSEPSDLDVNGIDLINARISYDDAAAATPVVLSDLNIAIGGIKGREVLLVDGFSIDGVVSGVASVPTELSVRTDEIVIDGEQSLMTLAPIVIDALGMRVNVAIEPLAFDSEVTPTVAIEVEPFSPRSIMTQFDVVPPETADPSALSEISIQATATLTSGSLDMSGVTFVLDDTTFTGDLSVPLSESGAYQFNFAGDSIDVGRYMAPADESVEVEAGESAPVDIPADLIRPLKASGKATLQQATLGAVVFDNIELGLNAADGKLRLHPISSDLFGGAYNGDVQIDASSSVPVLSVNERIETVDVGRLALAMYEVENVTGTINGTFRLSGRGSNTLGIQETLGGDLGFEITDGAFEGTDIWYEMRRARATLKGEAPPEPSLPAKTDFTAASLSGTVTDGVVRNADLHMQLPFMQLTGTGNVDLVSATVDYALKARVLDRPEFLGDVTQEEINDFTSTVIPLRITGPLADPSVTPDVEQLLRDRVEEEIKDRLKDKLGDLFN